MTFTFKIRLLSFNKLKNFSLGQGISKVITINLSVTFYNNYNKILYFPYGENRAQAYQEGILRSPVTNKN